MNKLLYIGKSNKRFTKGKLYDYMDGIGLDFAGGLNNITIKANKNLVTLRYEQHLEYFKKNFKILNEIEYQNLIRKNKLKNISKCKILL